MEQAHSGDNREDEHQAPTKCPVSESECRKCGEKGNFESVREVSTSKEENQGKQRTFQFSSELIQEMMLL